MCLRVRPCLWVCLQRCENILGKSFAFRKTAHPPLLSPFTHTFLRRMLISVADYFCVPSIICLSISRPIHPSIHG